MKRIAIHGVPRSGTSWLGSILDSSPETIYKLQPLFSYAFKGFLDDTSSGKKIHSFFELLMISRDEFMDQIQKKKSGEYPVFLKNKGCDTVVYKEARYHSILKNMLLQCNDIKIIGIVRNPFGVISSFFGAPKEFRKELGWKELEEWRFAEKKNENRPENYYGYEKWKEVTLLFLDLYKTFPDRFLIVNYENLVLNTLNEVEKIYAFCELKMSDQTLDFIRESKRTQSEDPYGVYRANHRHDLWREKLDGSIKNEIMNDRDFIKINKEIKWDI